MTQLSPAHSATWRLFLAASVRLIDRVEATLAEAGLPPLDWYDVLLTLKESPDHRLRLSEVADKVLVSRSNLTRLVDRLESAGLLCRERCPLDRRGAFAVLTDAGLAMQNRIWEVYSQAIADSFGVHLSPEENQVLQETLSRMLAALNAE